MRFISVLLLGLFSAFTSLADTLSTSSGQVIITKMVSGLDEPWAIEFLPNGSFLVTERGGKLLFISGGVARNVRGVPDVAAKGQGGLLDVMIPRDFEQTREVFLTYAKRLKGGPGTALAVGQLSADGMRLEGVRDLFEMSAGSKGGRHFGSRIVEARDGTLFVTIGERGDRDSAQDLSRHNGSVIRINRDGSIPADNPFKNTTGARPEIYSFGHRNAQGASLDANGKLWTVEHGAKGGDELNRIKPGANFGWPVISYGKHYSGDKIGIGTHKKGMEQPVYYWDPSIAPSGLLVYSGKLWPQWRNDFFVGSLKFDYIARLNGHPLREVEQIKGTQTGRVRDIIEAPDGSIWFISVGSGSVYRLAPG